MQLRGGFKEAAQRWVGAQGNRGVEAQATVGQESPPIIQCFGGFRGTQFLARPGTRGTGAGARGRESQLGEAGGVGVECKAVWW